MKRIALFTLLLLVVACIGMAQEPVYYNSTPTLKWTPAASVPDGSAFLPGDTVEYRIYKWDSAFGDIALQPESALTLVVTFVDLDPTTADANGEEEATVLLIPRVPYQVALYATHIDGGGNRTDYASPLRSSVAGDTASGIPFVYIPESDLPLPESGPTDLRDSGM